MKIAVVGATGLVGSVMLKVLEEGRYLSFDKITEIIPVASEKSVGKEIHFNNMPYKIVGIREAIAQKPEIAVFSAGGSVSREFAPLFAKAGTTVIDNSSAWRMEMLLIRSLPIPIVPPYRWFWPLLPCTRHSASAGLLSQHISQLQGQAKKRCNSSIMNVQG